jgi:DNA ligase-1
LPTIYLLSNHLKPSYVPLELGIGSQVLNNAVKDVSGAGRDVLKRLWDKWGDPGDVAFEAKVRSFYRFRFSATLTRLLPSSPI